VVAQSRVTIRDVANEAGVSITTVSHVLNNVAGKRVHPDTRARVQETASRLGYAPNALARSLRTHRSGTIGLIGDEIATTPFAGRIILGVQDSVRAHDAVLLITTTGYERDVEEREIGELLRRQVDGVLYTAMYHRQVTVPTTLLGLPLVVLNAYTDQDISWVVPDEVAGGWDATQVLVEAGHRRLAFLNDVDDIPARHGREEGFRTRAAAAGLSQAEDVVVVYATAEASGAHEVARPLLQTPHRPTGIFCFNDRMAMGVYRAAAELGLRIPEDLSVVGFDDQEYLADGLFPGLTTIALPHYEMGAWAGEQLFARIEAPAGEPPPAQTAKFRGPVVSRDSVSSPPR
jgi:LacI family transcriptional regulator